MHFSISYIIALHQGNSHFKPHNLLGTSLCTVVMGVYPKLITILHTSQSTWYKYSQMYSLPTSIGHVWKNLLKAFPTHKMFFFFFYKCTLKVQHESHLQAQEIGHKCIRILVKITWRWLSSQTSACALEKFCIFHIWGIFFFF